MSPKLNNMNELLVYLDSLEERVRELEKENTALLSQQDSLDRYIKELGGDAQKMLPKSSLLSTSFIQRAFAVWGHYFVAQLIISIPLVCIYIAFITFILREGISLIPTP